MTPKLVIVAGANGSGKSTNTKELIKAGFDVIDPDRIARNLNPNHPESAGLSAGKVAINKAKQNIEQGVSFTIETTLSSKNTYQSMVELAKKHQFEISLVYVGTEDSQINILRVADRVLKGGHNIPQKDIIRRYERSLTNYPFFFEQVDNNIIIDNTVQNTKKVEIYRGNIVSICDYSEIPNWLKKSLGDNKIKAWYKAPTA